MLVSKEHFDSFASCNLYISSHITIALEIRHTIDVLVEFDVAQIFLQSNNHSCHWHFPIDTNSSTNSSYALLLDSFFTMFFSSTSFFWHLLPYHVAIERLDLFLPSFVL